MSKNFKRMISLMVVIGLIVSLFAIVGKMPQKAEASAKFGDISFLRPGYSKESLKSKDLFDKAVARAISLYEKNYGGKVNIVYSDWVNWNTKIIARMAAGDPIDVIFGSDGTFPRYYLQGIVQPLDNYVDLKAPYLNKTAMDLIFKYNGKYYLASQKGSNVPILCIYNKDLMLEEGIDEDEMPLALYKAGKWNWDAFEKLAKKLTADTNKDGKIDRYGVNFWSPTYLVYANGTSFVTLDKNGKAKVNFDDPALQRALNFYKKGKKEGWLMDDWDITVSGLKKRQTVMLVAPLYKYDQDKKEVEDELEAAPLPLGPDNKKKVYVFHADGYGISKGAKNPRGAGKFINLILENVQKYHDDVNMSKRSKFIFDIVGDMAKNPFYPSAPDSLTGLAWWELFGPVNSQDSVASALASLKPQIEKNVKEAYSGTATKIVYKPFKPFAINFDDGKVDTFKSLDTNKKTVKISVASGSDAIKNKSLIVTWDTAKDGAEIYVVTNPDKVKIYGWHDYKISFEVKTTKAAKSGKPTVVCSILSEPKPGATSYGNLTVTVDKTNTVYKVEGNITNIPDNSDKMCLKIGIQNGAGNFIIDNLKVEELE